MKRVLKWIGVSLLIILVVANVVGRTMNAPPYRGPVSDHFDGERFHNVEPVDLPSVWRGIRYALTTDHGPWDEWRDVPTAPPPPSRVAHDSLKVTYINHATTLVQMGGVNILTDPTWSARASPFTWTGPKRRHPPGLRLDQLPDIDVVLLSHNHYDHTDLATLDTLSATHLPLFIVGLGSAALLQKRGIGDIRELDWNTETTYRGLRFVGQRCRHFSGRGMSDRQRTLWMSYIIEGHAGRVYFSGDTGYGSHFVQTGARFGPIRLAILPIGAYLPKWFMGSVHIDPAEAVQAHRDLRAQTSLAVHYGTFRLSEEGQDDPVIALREALSSATDIRFWILPPGEGQFAPQIP